MRRNCAMYANESNQMPIQILANSKILDITKENSVWLATRLHARSLGNVFVIQ
jgi:hypothetical protein